MNENEQIDQVPPRLMDVPEQRRSSFDIVKVIRLSLMALVIAVPAYYKGVLDGENLQKQSGKRYSKQLRTIMEEVCSEAKVFVEDLRKRQHADPSSLTTDDRKKIAEYYQKLIALAQDHDEHLGPDEALAVRGIFYWMNILKTLLEETDSLLKDTEKGKPGSVEKPASVLPKIKLDQHPSPKKKEWKTPKSGRTIGFNDVPSPFQSPSVLPSQSL